MAKKTQKDPVPSVAPEPVEPTVDHIDHVLALIQKLRGDLKELEKLVKDTQRQDSKPEETPSDGGTIAVISASLFFL